MPKQPDSERPVVVVSNRGPLKFRYESDGTLLTEKAAGGLVSSLLPAVRGTNTIWMSAAPTSSDLGGTAVASDAADGFRLETVPIDADQYRLYYEVIANGTLWFLHHNLFDLARFPRIDSQWWEAWHAYCDVNRRFAEAIADSAPDNAIVLVHDYHLTLIGNQLRRRRPDLRTVHFHHTPFTGRNTIHVLPTAVARTLLGGLAGHHACGFHSQRWADSFKLSCNDVLGHAPKTFVSAAAPDIDDIRKVASSPQCRAETTDIEKLKGDRKLVVRVDRIELSKNLLRGFQAFDDLLERYPRWRERVIFAAFTYPSREAMPEYAAYRDEVIDLVHRINQRWAKAGWQPIELRMRDDFTRSVAAYLEYDVLLVNPIRDGLNLVAKEGAILNERNGAILLSREAGSWTELGDGAIGINPYDISGTADALLHALEMSDAERTSRAAILREAALRRTPNDWLADQVRAALPDETSASD